ncbi:MULTISPECIES: MATE family efflux transporter [Clostridium]|uniref:Probable multidrug resistance protein NorM n=1 Tax=Clostridium senegalense TaxID=1465809 RepID=A0A6M0HA94_9CLOT|nr:MULTISPECIES: MATE family efflux transporter [Clostridium]NEU06632.1 MATE family efflux transporter [Clostridium senegalense]
MEKNNKILTEGNIYKSLLMFAIPFLIANFIQALYGAVDMAIVGWFGSSISISAVSIGSQVMQILTSLISGLTMGGTILIAQYFGAEKEKDTVETISTMLTLFVGFAILFTIVMMFLTPSFLKMLRTPVEAFSGAKEYVLICSMGIIFIFGYNGISAMLRGIGDSKSPMIFILVACITNIVLDLILVGIFKLGPAGAAIATIASQGLSMILAIIYLSKQNFIFQFKFKNFKIHKDKALKLIKLGIPVSLQETMVSVSFLIITAIINTLGVVPAAAVGIASKFDMFAMLPAIAFSGAITSITAQNIGANKPERAKKALNASMLLAFLCSIVFFAWAQISAQSIMHMFKADADVTLAGSQYMRTFSIDFMLVAFGFCQNGFLNGCGKTKFTMINGILASILIRVPLAYILSVYIPTSLLGIGIAAPIATFISVTISFVYIKSGRWNKI